MKKLYVLFAEYTNNFGQQLFVHKYKYCTAREIIKEKRILEDTLKTFEAYDQARDYVIGMTGNGNEIRDILAAS